MTAETKPLSDDEKTLIQLEVQRAQARYWAGECDRLRAENRKLVEAIEEHLEARRKAGGKHRTDDTLKAAIAGHSTEPRIIQLLKRARGAIDEQAWPELDEELRAAIEGK